MAKQDGVILDFSNLSAGYPAAYMADEYGRIYRDYAGEHTQLPGMTAFLTAALSEDKDKIAEAQEQYGFSLRKAQAPTSIDIEESTQRGDAQELVFNTRKDAAAAKSREGRQKQQLLENLINDYGRYEQDRAKFRENIHQHLDEDRDKLFTPGKPGKSSPASQLPLDNTLSNALDDDYESKEKEKSGSILDALIGAFGS